MRERRGAALACMLMYMLYSPAAAGAQGEGSEILTLLPRAGDVGGWMPDDEPEYAAGEDLFYLINGGAAIYREYGFNEAVYQTYVTKDGKSINLEIYAMDSPEAAFGIYTFKTGRDGQPVDSVHDGWLESYYLNFWKGNYQVTVIGLDPEDTVQKSLAEIARFVEKKIKPGSQTPRLISFFPREKLLPNGITYLKGNLAIFNKYEFDRTNVFGVREGALGEYENHAVFIFEYENEDESKKWYVSARDFLEQSERFENFEDFDTRFEISDSNGDRLAVAAHYKWIIIVMGANPANAGQILKDYRSVLE